MQWYILDKNAKAESKTSIQNGIHGKVNSLKKVWSLWYIISLNTNIKQNIKIILL